MTISLRPARRAVTAAATLATVLTAVGAGPVHADSQTARDTARDVRNYTSSTQSTRVRRDAGRDLLKATARYRWGKVQIALGMRNVKRSGYQFSVMLKSATGTYNLIYDHEGATPSIDYLTPVGETRTCPSARVRPRRADDSIKIVLDRSCVGGKRAKWIRFGVRTAHTASSGVLGDELRRDDVDWNNHPRFGSRVHYN